MSSSERRLTLDPELAREYALRPTRYAFGQRFGSVGGPFTGIVAYHFIFPAVPEFKPLRGGHIWDFNAEELSLIRLVMGATFISALLGPSLYLRYRSDRHRQALIMAELDRRRAVAAMHKAA